MTVHGLKRWFGPRWGEVLAQMLAQGFVRCSDCDGLPWGPLLDAHKAGCRGRVGQDAELDSQALGSS